MVYYSQMGTRNMSRYRATESRVRRRRVWFYAHRQHDQRVDAEAKEENQEPDSRQFDKA